MVVRQVVEPSDYEIGDIVLRQGLTDARLVDLWRDIMAHRHPSRADASKKLSTDLRSLIDRRNRALHSHYIAMMDHDPVDDSDLRQAAIGAVNWRASGLPKPTEVDVQEFVALAADCTKLKAELTTWAKYT
jgi:hypothetical protein